MISGRTLARGAGCECKMSPDFLKAVSMICCDGDLSLVSHPKAYDRAAEMLRQAQKPLLCGWASTVCEAQKKELPGATLSQVKNQADTKVFCGRFTSEGREGGKIVVVDVRETRTSKNADREKCGMCGIEIEVGGNAGVFLGEHLCRCSIRMRGDAGDFAGGANQESADLYRRQYISSRRGDDKRNYNCEGEARIMPSYQKTEIISIEGEYLQKYVCDLVEKGADEVFVRVGSS